MAFIFTVKLEAVPLAESLIDKRLEVNTSTF